jgi:hypothetical protein
MTAQIILFMLSIFSKFIIYYINNNFAELLLIGKKDLSFSDQYKFNGSWYNPPSWFSDNAPEVVAGPGTPFTITGGWVDQLKGSFSTWSF